MKRNSTLGRWQLIAIQSLALLFLVMNLHAGTPHLIGGKITYPNGSYPSSSLTFSAYILGRPADILTQSSANCAYYPASGNYQVQCGNFANAWSVGDVFHIDINDGAGGTVSSEITLTSAGSQLMNISITPATPSAPVTGTITQPTCDVATGSVALSGLPSFGTWTLTLYPEGTSSTGTGTTTTVSNLTTGTHYFTVTSAAGGVSANSDNVVINAQPVIPSQPSAITGNASPCQGATGLSYSVTNVAGVTYTWSVPAGWSITAGQNTNTITATAGASSGDITVTPSNGCGNGTARTLAVTVNALPAQPSAITGNSNPCQGVTGLSYSVTNVAGVTYTWSVPAGWSITAGQGTNSMTATAGATSGNVTVTPSNGCGNGTAQTLAVTVSAVPAQPSTITGTSNPCQGITGLSYSVTNVAGVTYTWEVPSGWSITAGQGTNSVTVTAGSTEGNITVTPSNGCGNGSARTLAVTANTLPAQPSAITGNASPCQGATGLSYSVTNVAGVTYTWAVPSGWSVTAGQGTNAVTVTAGTIAGDITVTPSNGCGNGTARTLAVTTTTVPAQPGTISGNNNPCQGTTGVAYSVTNVAGVTYTWAAPAGWTISTGQGTNSVTVTVGTVSGNITVTPSNTCGNGTAQTLAVTVNPLPAQPSAITGNSSPCQGATGLTYSVTNVAGVTYAWTVPVGWSITAGQGTNSITATAGATSGNVAVTPSNTCGNGTVQTLAVAANNLPAQPSAITGNASPCQGATGLSYSVTNVAGVTYTWEVPPGWSITAGQGTNAVAVTAGSGSGNVTVTPSNTCGNGTVRTLAVAANTVPAQPSAITGNSSPCQGVTGLTYSVTNVAGVTYTWAVPAGWSITAGQGTNSITATAGVTSGNVGVTPSNTCGNGTAQTLAVSVSLLPAQPSTITGNSTPCQGVTGLTYSVTNVAGVTYTWTVPAGWSITAGQGTNTITATAGATSGNVAVTPSNTCGNGTAQTLAVTVNLLPAQPSAITGNSSPCQIATGLTYSVTNIAGVTYTWAVPAGWSITAGQGTNSITVTAGTTSGNISVTPSNTCGNGTAQTLAVTTSTVPAQPSAITGNSSPCQGVTGLTYSVTNVAGVTYTWTVPAGWSITAGQGTNAITATAGVTSGNVGVTPSNTCGNGTAQTLAVTVSLLPAQPSTITGNSTPCQGVTGLTYSITNVAGVSYTWTVPAGWSITAGQGTNTITATASANSGNVTVTPSNTCGNGTAQTLVVTVSLLPAQPSAITGNSNPCQGATGLIYSVTNVAGVTYTWAVPAGWSITAGQGTNSVTVTAGTSAGNIGVTPSNACGNGTARTLAVTTNTVPSQPSAVTGNNSPCQGATGLAYSVTNVAGVTYTWIVPADWSINAGQGTNSVTVTAGTSAGNIGVTPSNACGNGTARTLAVTVNTVPAQPSAVTGNTNPCQGTTGLIYSVTNVAGVTYAWTVPSGWSITAGQGTNSITATAGANSGNVTVTPSNTCGNGTIQTLAVTVSPLPSQPSAITGSSNPCQGTTGLAYSVTNVAGVTYTWAVPSGWSITAGQGTNAITVTAGTTSGNITVTPSNACGNGTARTLAVTANTIPSQPGAITGNTNPCQGVTGLAYSVTNVAGVTYTWAVPSGWSITAGQGTNAITATAGANAGNVTVTPSNACGNGTAQTLAVTVNTIPAQPGAITGNGSPCQGITGLVYSVTNVTSVTYTWTVPTGWSITAGQGTNAITATAGANAGNVTVTPSNTCGNGIIQTLAVTVSPLPAQPSAITGSSNPCQGTTGLAYSVTNVAGVTYTWAVPSGWSITAGQGTNAIAATAGANAGNITVTPSNACGNGTARALAVTVNTVPAQPGTITGDASVCEGSSHTYSIAAVSGATSYTWTLPSGWTGSSTSISITATAGANSGNVSVTATNACGTGVSRALSVTVSAVPSAPIVGTITHPSCAVGTGSVVLSGLPSSGTWTLTRTPGGSATGTGTSTTVTGLAAGTYTFTVANASGCTSASSGNVVINANPSTPSSPVVGTITQPENADETGSVYLSGLPATGTWTITRTPGGTTNTGTGTTTTVTGLPAGMYTFTVTNALGCISAPSASVHVNAVPVITEQALITMNEDDSLTMSTDLLFITDPDNSTGQMTVKAFAGDHYTVLGDTLIIPEANFCDSLIVPVTVNDGIATSESYNVVIMITPVNDTPVISNIPDQSVSEGTSFAMISLNDFISDIETADEDISWTFAGNTDLIVSIVNQVATVTVPDEDWNGSETIVFRATDNDQTNPLSAEDAAIFAVIAVNDAPVVTTIPDQTIEFGKSFEAVDLDSYVSDVETADENIAWTSSGNTNLSVTITNRIASIEVINASWYGKETITFTATDNDVTDPLSDSKTAQFEVLEPTSFNDMADDEKISVYPNPTSGTLFISAQSIQSGQVNVEVISMNGQVVHLKDYASHEGKVMVDLGNLSCGSYLVKVITTKTVHIFKIDRN
jgi:hypothetical protein